MNLRNHFLFSFTALVAVSVAMLAVVVEGNDECSNAVRIQTLPFKTTGDTTDATADFPNPTDTFRNLTCGIGVEGRGIWFEYVGDNRFVEATVSASSSSSPDSWNIKTALFQIYNGDSECHADDLQCMTSSQYAKLSERTSTPVSQWYANSGIKYLLHVSGVTDDDVGPFEINMKVREKIKIFCLYVFISRLRYP